MGLLDGLVGQIAAQALGKQTQGNGGALGNVLGDALGKVLGGTPQNSGTSGGLGGALGSLLGGQQGAALGNVLGSLMGGQNSSATTTGQQGGLAGIPPQLLMALVPLVLGFVQKQGGLEGILAKLQQSGLGDHAKSWVSQGENQVVAPAQMQALFGGDAIANVASQVGVDPSLVSQGLSALLPQIINQLTPNGDTSHATSANSEIGQILAAFGAK